MAAAGVPARVADGSPLASPTEALLLVSGVPIGTVTISTATELLAVAVCTVTVIDAFVDVAQNSVPFMKAFVSGPAIAPTFVQVSPRLSETVRSAGVDDVCRADAQAKMIELAAGVKLPVVTDVVAAAIWVTCTGVPIAMIYSR